MSYDFYQTDHAPSSQPTEPLYRATPPGIIPPPLSPAKPRRTARRIIPAVLIGATLVILSILALLSHILLPASAATVTFVPIPQSLTQSHTFSTADHTDFTSNQVAARKITFTTPVRTKQENTSGTGHLDAVQAKGQLILFPQNATSAGDIKNAIIHGPNGINIDTDDSLFITIIPNQATTVPAHIEQAGKVGNVPAYFIDGNYSPGDDPGLILHIYNPAPFTGGKDAYDGPMVQLADISQVVGDLTTQVQQEAQQNLQNQLRPGEGLLDMQCTPRVQTQAQEGMPAATIKASGSATCQGTAYDLKGILGWIHNDMQQAAIRRFGPHLGLAGQFHTDTTLLTGAIQLFVQSDWAVRLDPAGKQALTRAIAGKSQDEAKNILFRQFSVQTTDISLSGWGLHLPADPTTIQLTVHQATGLSIPVTSSSLFQLEDVAGKVVDFIQLCGCQGSINGHEFIALVFAHDSALH